MIDPIRKMLPVMSCKLLALTTPVSSELIRSVALRKQLSF